MTNEPALEAMSLEERARVKKQMGEQSVKLAVASRWQEAANMNREYLRTFGDEAEAFNRLGKAQTELGQITDARASYGKSLELDPANGIARRNLDRLAGLKDTSAATPSQLIRACLWKRRVRRRSRNCRRRMRRRANCSMRATS